MGAALRTDPGKGLIAGSHAGHLKIAITLELIHIATLVHDDIIDGAEIRLPGFAIPLDTDTKIAKSFILVPYYGACIHTPPPPSNQIVLVRAPQGARIEEAFAMVWVTGRLRVEAQQTDVAHAGYTLDARSVAPYEE